ncbi:MFS transporter [Streptomyces sp. NPDC005438]|uniref:MFS transporter n=1 Tax=Streptomyces sp. NPDC005438 TaxID=3156880 RepID=UPI0033BAE1BD
MSAPARAGSWYGDPVQRLLVVGSLLNALAFFATVPFLTLYLSAISDLSDAVVGGIAGSIALVSAFGGLWGGGLADRLGGTRMIRVGLALNVAVYATLTLVRQVALVVPLVALLGVARLLVEPAMKKLMSLTAAGSSGETVFRVRYVTLCLGATLGPLGGALLFRLAHWMIFLTPAVLYGCYLLLLQFRASSLGDLDRVGDAESRAGSWRRALRDRGLVRVVGAGLVLFLVFSQFEMILPLYLRDHYGQGGVSHFSLMLALTSVLAILFQWPAERLSRRLSRPRLALVGCVGFALACPLFRGLESHLLFLYLGAVVWTFGEAVLFPLPDAVIHDLTPDSQKGAYYGLAELRYLGFFFGPVLGGALLPVSATLYFGLMAVTVFGTWLLLRDPRLHRPHPAPGSPS